MQDDKDLSSLKALAAKLDGWYSANDFKRAAFDGAPFSEQDWAYILAANPAAILSLLSRLEKADLLGDHYEMLCQSKDARLAELEAALQVYADPSNWRLDDNQIARVWHEPDSSSPEAYAGFEHATNVLAAQDEAEVASRCRAQGGNTCAESVCATPARDVGGLTEAQREAVRDAIAGALGEAYDCTRVWSAWGYGTMGPNDFVLVAEDDDRLNEITEAVCEVLATKEAEPNAGLIERYEARKDGYAEGYGDALRTAESVCKLSGDACASRDFVQGIEYCANAIRALATSPAPSVKQQPNEKPIARLQAEVSKRPFSEGRTFYEIVILDRDRCFDGMELFAAPSASQGEVKVPEDQNSYFGEDCPQGMVQVEFVGCDPRARKGDYGWKPVKSAMLDIWVDGRRFNITVGDIGYGEKQRRGLHVVTSAQLIAEQAGWNAADLYYAAPSVTDGEGK